MPRAGTSTPPRCIFLLQAHAQQHLISGAPLRSCTLKCVQHPPGVRPLFAGLLWANGVLRFSCRVKVLSPSPQVLAVHLLHEVSKGEVSFWCPYLRSLPRSYTTAMCFRPGDIEALQVGG